MHTSEGTFLQHTVLELCILHVPAVLQLLGWIPLNNTSDLYKETFSTGLVGFLSFKTSHSSLMLITKETAFNALYWIRSTCTAPMYKTADPKQDIELKFPLIGLQWGYFMFTLMKLRTTFPGIVSRTGVDNEAGSQVLWQSFKKLFSSYLHRGNRTRHLD